MTLLLHLQRCVLNAVEHASEVNGDELVEVLVTHLVNGEEVGDAGIVVHGVDRAVCLHREVDKALDLRRIAGVGLVEDNIGRYSLELLKCLGATLLIAAGDYDLGALLQERLRGGQANARGATSDNRRLALDFKHEFLQTVVH